MNKELPESREKEIFRELLDRNGDIKSPGSAARLVADRNGLSLEVIKAIEQKGMARDWPPLD
jgi:hypothetical protein